MAMQIREPVFANRLLKLLPAEEIRTLRPLMTRVRLVRSQRIYEFFDKVEFLYFVENGLISTAVVFDAAQSQVHVDVFGHQSVVGAAATLNTSARSFHRTAVQMPGIAYRISTDAIRGNLGRLPTLRRLLLEDIDIAGARVSQNAACRTAHLVSERLASWLLMASGLANSDDLELTQEFIAKMLAVRRPAVTVALGRFEALGFIHHRRGHIIIANREELTSASCNCDRHLHQYIADVFGERGREDNSENHGMYRVGKTAARSDLAELFQ